MLNKEICQECMNKHFIFRWEWSKYDDERWKQGKVYCAEHSIGLIKIVHIDRIPLGCRYELEQFIVSQMLNKEICQECIDRHSVMKWFDKDTKNWGERIINCVAAGYVSNDEIPNECCYQLEQFIVS